MLVRGFRYLKRTVPPLIGVDPITRLRFHRYPVRRLGRRDGGWHVPQLRRGSICYCCGCGENISFDMALVAEGHDVWGFDPTPRSIEYLRRSAPSRYHFMPVGIWSSDSSLDFFAPANRGHSSYSALNLQRTTESFRAPVRSIPSLMRELGHTRLDLLKLDIEGAEYEVLKSIGSTRIGVLCVEFDENFHPLDAGYVDRITSAILSLKRQGFEMIHTTGNANYTFLHDGEHVTAP